MKASEELSAYSLSSLASQTQPIPAESDPRWGWLGLACETNSLSTFDAYIEEKLPGSPHKTMKSLVLFLM